MKCSYRTSQNPVPHYRVTLLLNVETDARRYHQRCSKNPQWLRPILDAANNTSHQLCSSKNKSRTYNILNRSSNFSANSPKITNIIKVRKLYKLSWKQNSIKTKLDMLQNQQILFCEMSKYFKNSILFNKTIFSC